MSSSLRWYGRNVQKKINDRILDKLEVVGELVEGSAKVLTPVDTGNLRDSINHKVIPKRKVVRIGTNVEYAPHVEFGTYKMNAQPFLRPAVIENRNAIKKILKNIRGLR